jgi:predicted transcriptional regulator
MESYKDVNMKDALIENIDKIHTTEMGVGRIQRNLGITDEPVSYCISKLEKESSTVTKEGKNYYVDVDDCIITINSSSYTIITAHKKK